MSHAFVRAGLALGIMVVACGTSSSRDGFDEQPPPAPPPAPSASPPLDNGGADHRTVTVSIDGTTFAPNGTLPIANTLVYVTQQQPAKIPESAYCDECVALPEDTFAMSGADGKFTITAQIPKGKTFVVVQKGQFRRVRTIDVTGDTTLTLDAEKTTLPGKADATKGDDVPRMVVLKDDSDFDHIDESLQKLGITSFDLRTDRTLLENKTELMKYHVVFVPCGDSADAFATSPTAKANLQAFVEAGGKLYVTDWSYEFVRQPFPGMLSWVGETAKIGSAASGDEWDAPAVANDQGLSDWLAATGDPKFDVKGNWTKIGGLGTVKSTDAKGQALDVTPKVWVSAQVGAIERPTTISFQDKCGRVLYSTYHTESGFGGSTSLLAQEKALLYVLLEVGVCVGKGPGVN